MDLNEILIFARIVQAGSFTAAAQGLGMPKSTVSRKLSQLEDRLGARLIQRTTRKLSMSDVGRAYYQDCKRIVAQLEEAELAVTSMQAEPRGLLRITAPLNFGFVGVIAAEFLSNYPQVQMELQCTDRMVDLVEEGFDIGIRAGRLSDSTLIARPLGAGNALVVASAEYTELHGVPGTPHDLKGHQCLLFGAGWEGRTWTLKSGSRTLEVPVRPRLAVNDLEILREAALSGAGVAMLPAHHCTGDLRSGRLRRLLPEWTSPDTPTFAVYPSTRHLSPKVKAFLDLLQERLTPPPWNLDPAP
ncbi:MAG: LysR family transcriptional regulator [SAR324 cluster bacterium]|nr:LysR family transcriptional regulator [SAR324 cluster bacterium]MCZ6534344.1 LysR family transcriptional regulator [SAR324 cluster bacterium]MCZ6841808.1 LysR family transcriptional regulator [SAR324 cluster bacterium]